MPAFVHSQGAHVMLADGMADWLGLPLLGRLPIDPNIAALCDKGQIEYYLGDGFQTIAEQIVDLTPDAARTFEVFDISKVFS